MHTFPRNLLLAAALAVASSLTCAAAKDDQHGSSVEVRYGDLNLESPEGVRILKRRISNAALHVCGADEAPALVLMNYYRTCVQLANERALAQVRWPSR